MHSFETDSQISDGTTYQHVVHAGSCRLAKVTVFNNGSSARFLKIFDKAIAPNPAVDTIKWHLVLNVTGGVKEEFSLDPEEAGLLLQNGLAYTVTTQADKSGTTAAALNDCIINMAFVPIT